MAPLSVLVEGAPLLVAAAAVVALEGLLYCEQEFQLITKYINNIKKKKNWHSTYAFPKFAVSLKTDDSFFLSVSCFETEGR